MDNHIYIYIYNIHMVYGHPPHVMGILTMVFFFTRIHDHLPIWVNCPRFDLGTYEGLSYSNTNKTHKLY